jgi:hypothetical protein
MTNRVSMKENEVIAPTEVYHNFSQLYVYGTANYSNWQAVHSLELDKVIADKEKINREVDVLRQTIDKKREKVYNLASNSVQIREKMVSLSSSSQVADARTSYAINLYNKISCVTWDYNVSPGRLGGCKSVKRQFGPRYRFFFWFIISL